MDKNFYEMFYDNDNEDIASVCLNCGYEAIVPDFIYDEFGVLIKHKELNNEKVWTINCNNCDEVKVVPKNYLEQQDVK